MTTTTARLSILLTLGIALCVISIQKSSAFEMDISAFGTLSELSIRSENERLMGSNLLFIGAGAAAIGGIGAHLDGSYEAASLLSIGSALALGGGVALRYFETSTEQALNRVMLIEDPVEREQRSRDALFQMASEQRNSRLVSGVFNAGLASYYFIWSDGSDEAVFSGVVSALTSLVAFSFRSPAERAVAGLQNNRSASNRESQLDWGLAVTGNAITVAIRF